MTPIKKFNGLNVSSKFAICGLPIRIDSYKTCSFGCKYCFAENRKIMQYGREIQIANVINYSLQIGKKDALVYKIFTIKDFIENQVRFLLCFNLIQTRKIVKKRK